VGGAGLGSRPMLCFGIGSAETLDPAATLLLSLLLKRNF
jgi:hypothetical protein